MIVIIVEDSLKEPIDYSTNSTGREREYEKKHTWVSVTLSNLAISALSPDERYFFTSNSFSSSKIWRPVKVVLAFFRLPAPVSSPSSLVSDPSPPRGDLTSSVDFFLLINFEGSGRKLYLYLIAKHRQQYVTTNPLRFDVYVLYALLLKDWWAIAKRLPKWSWPVALYNERHARENNQSARENTEITLCVHFLCMRKVEYT